MYVIIVLWYLIDMMRLSLRIYPQVPIKVIDNALYVRISVHIYNTIDDYRHLAKTVQDLAER